MNTVNELNRVYSLHSLTHFVHGSFVHLTSLPLSELRERGELCEPMERRNGGRERLAELRKSTVRTE